MKPSKKQERQAYRQALKMELKEHKSSFLVFSILRILVIVSMVRQLFLHNYEGFFFCILTLALLYLPSLIQVRLRIEIPIALEITILCFIFAAEILGEINAFYQKIPFWDTILHTLNGFLCNSAMMTKMLKIPELQNPLTGLNFQGTGKLSTPLGAQLHRTGVVADGVIIGLDNRYALEQVRAGDVMVEYDKLIDRQLERAAITSICGFGKICTEAAAVLNV